jgi:hypothetical protein
MLRNPYEKTNRLISPPRIRINEVFKASYKIRLFGYSWGYLPIKIDKIASFSMFLFLDLASLKPPDPHLMLSLSKTRWKSPASRATGVSPSFRRRHWSQPGDKRDETP